MSTGPDTHTLVAAERWRKAVQRLTDHSAIVLAAEDVYFRTRPGGEPELEREYAVQEALHDDIAQARARLYESKPQTLRGIVALIQCVRDEEDVFAHDEQLASAFDDILAALRGLRDGQA